MIDFNQAVSIIRRNGGFKPNRKDTSYYRTYTIEDNRPLQARVSNHGTWLWTWYDKDFDPSYAINFCVVFSENGEYDSDVSVDMEIKDEEGNVVGQRKTFEVTQYVYNCQLLDINDATLINQQVQSIWQNKGFKDPFANTPKHAKVMKLKPNEPIEPIVENKDIKTRYNMNKKLIRLTESDLHNIVKKSVNRVLNEGCDYNPSPEVDNESYNNLDEKEDIAFVLNAIGKTWNEIGGANKVDKLLSLYREVAKITRESEDSSRLPMGSESEWMKGQTLAYKYKDFDKENFNEVQSKLYDIITYERDLLNTDIRKLNYCLKGLS